MRRLFRSFERFGVEYLLISGQASVLYGAATFSEDVRLGGRVQAEFLADVGRLQARDTAYWRRIVQDLRRLRKDGRLIETGTPVARLVGRTPP